jgi:Fe-S cluster assembly protein SufD
MSVIELNETSQAFARHVLGSDQGAPVPAGARAQADARARLGELSLPAKKDEEWRFIRLRPLTSTDLVPASEIDAQVSQAMIDDYAVPEAKGRQLVFVNGRYSAELSDVSAVPDGVRMGSLAEDVPADIAERLGGVSDYYADDYFWNLNTAGFTDGGYVVVDEDISVDGAIQLLYVSTESSTAYAVNPRNLIVVGQGSKATFVEDYVGPHSSVYFNNVATEISVADNATARHTIVQRESMAAFHIARRVVDLARGASYDSKTVALGARLSRFDVYANGGAENIDCTLDGLAVLSDKQVSDTHTVMDHRKPHAGSHQLHKMILDDSSHAVFNGKIFVQPHAQIIDAYQLNRTLLLSERAKVNAKPQLEIFADDVKCTHGATIGQLEDDPLFYMRTRGLSEETARTLLVYAFAAEVLDTIPVVSLRDKLEDAVFGRTAGT